jgi:hypothetical protein
METIQTEHLTYENAGKIAEMVYGTKNLIHSETEIQEFC